MGQKKNAYKIFVGKPKGKRTLGTPRLRWEDNINMDFKEILGKMGTRFIYLGIESSGELL
jgi:hypothetical protein